MGKKIEKSKKPKSEVPGDLRKRLLTEFAPELATPMTKIFQNIINSQQWPSMWKTEFGIPLQKVPNPIDEDQLRVISLTPFFSKVTERFVVKWLLYWAFDRLQVIWRYEGLLHHTLSHRICEFYSIKPGKY